MPSVIGVGIEVSKEIVIVKKEKHLHFHILGCQTFTVFIYKTSFWPLSNLASNFFGNN